MKKYRTRKYQKTTAEVYDLMLANPDREWKLNDIRKIITRRAYEQGWHNLLMADFSGGLDEMTREPEGNGRAFRVKRLKHGVYHLERKQPEQAVLVSEKEATQYQLEAENLAESINKANKVLFEIIGRLGIAQKEIIAKEAALYSIRESLKRDYAALETIRRDLGKTHTRG